jgi:hypothetical protein
MEEMEGWRDRYLKFNDDPSRAFEAELVMNERIMPDQREEERRRMRAEGQIQRRNWQEHADRVVAYELDRQERSARELEAEIVVEEGKEVQRRQEFNAIRTVPYDDPRRQATPGQISYRASEVARLRQQQRELHAAMELDDYSTLTDELRRGHYLISNRESAQHRLTAIATLLNNPHGLNRPDVRQLADVYERGGREHEHRIEGMRARQRQQAEQNSQEMMRVRQWAERYARTGNRANGTQPGHSAQLDAEVAIGEMVGEESFIAL